MGMAAGLASAVETDSAAFTGTVWAQGVTRESGWYDAQKNHPYNGDADDLMCYAACAANLIAWWQKSEYAQHLTSAAPKDIDRIWQTYVNSNLKMEGGDTPAAVNWWISGVYAPTTDADWGRYHAEKFKEYLPLTLPRTNGYYYDQYGLTSQDLSSLIFDAWIYGEWSKDGDAEIDFRKLFESGACLSLAIIFPDADLGHAITLWGVEYKNGALTRLWVTDSDDYWSPEPTIFGVSVSEGADGKIHITGTEYDEEATDEYPAWKYYEGAYIDSVYAIMAPASANWKLVPEPSTATLSLLALAALSARRRRK